MTWSAALPPLHRGWLEVILDREVVGEVRSACETCVMCTHQAHRAEPAASAQQPQPPDARTRSSLVESGLGFVDPPLTPFSASTKCCTYLPELANFLVGGILAEPESPGSDSLEVRFAEDPGAVTPLGLAKSRQFADRYAADSFGRDPSLRCPHYISEDGGKCAIWLHREAICSTWFCHFDRGVASKRFWATASRFFKAMEASLARWCASRVAGDDPVLASWLDTTSDSFERVAHVESAPAKAWGSWQGRERAFYLACAEQIGQLTVAEQLAIGGSNAQLAARLMQDAFAERNSDRLPDLLSKGQWTVLAVEGPLAYVETYSPLDPLGLSATLLRALQTLDGQFTPAEALRHLDPTSSQNTEPDLLRKLIDFGLLQRAHRPRQDLTGTLSALRTPPRGDE